MTIYYHPTTHQFPWSLVKVNKSKMKTQKKFKREIQEKHTPTCIVKSNCGIKNSTLQKSSPFEDYHHLKFCHDQRSFYGRIGGDTPLRASSSSPLCLPPSFLSFFLFLFFCFPRPTIHLYIYMYILNKFKNVMHVLSFNNKLNYHYLLYISQL